MINLRAKGLGFCREVKGILQGMGHIVEGPGFKSLFFGGRVNAVHSDYFGCFDLISFDKNTGKFIFHQVSDLKNKARKVHEIQNAQMNGWMWARINKGRRIGYRLFIVTSDSVEEGEVIFKSNKSIKDQR